MAQTLYGGSFMGRGYQSPEEMALAKLRAKEKAIDEAKTKPPERLANVSYGPEYETFAHMHMKDEFNRDKCAYVSAYKYIRAFYSPDFNGKISLSLNDAIGLMDDIELIRNAAIEWIKAS